MFLFRDISWAAVPLDTRAAEYYIRPIVLILANVGSETNVYNN